jgi:hypothetical protein
MSACSDIEPTGKELTDIHDAWAVMDTQGFTAMEFAVLLEANKTFGTSGGNLFERSKSNFYLTEAQFTEAKESLIRKGMVSSVGAISQFGLKAVDDMAKEFCRVTGVAYENGAYGFGHEFSVNGFGQKLLRRTIVFEAEKSASVEPQADGGEVAATRYTIEKSEHGGFQVKFLDDGLQEASDWDVDLNVLEARTKENLAYWDSSLKTELEAIIAEGHVNGNGAKLTAIVPINLKRAGREAFLELRYQDEAGNGSGYRAYHDELRGAIAKHDHQATPEYAEERRLAEEIRALTAKLNQEAQEKQAAIDAHVKSVVSKIDGLSPLAAGKLENTLKVRLNYRNHGILMRYEFIEKIMAAGGKLSVEQVNKYKEPTRVQFNRMNQDEQNESAKKIREGGTVAQYLMNEGGVEHIITKSEYEYAKVFAEAAPESEGNKEAAQPSEDLAFLQSIIDGKQSEAMASPDFADKLTDMYARVQGVEADLALFNSALQVYTDFVLEATK